MLSDVKVMELRSRMRGPLIAARDPEFDEARKLWNAMIDKRPALIAQCVDVADVIAAVNFGRDNGVTVAVRGGGHSGPGLGSIDDGLVIDLRRLKGIRVDPLASTVQVQGGCTWGEVDHATHPFGLAVPSGVISTTGVGGLALGGGMGSLTRQYGLTIDNLLGVDMVLADGSFVTADADHHPDLFWAVRGGGGNFGVVTSFLFRASPVAVVYGGPILWKLEHGRTIFRFWRDLMLSDPEDLNGLLVFHKVPPAPPFPEQYHMENMCMGYWCYTGDLSKAEEVFRPIRAVAPAAIDLAGPLPLPVLNSLFDGLQAPGQQSYWNGDFFTELSDEAMELHLEHGAQVPTFQSTALLYPINGAAHRMGPNDTAFSFRDANFSQAMLGVSPDPADNPRIIKWSKDYWAALHPYSAGGAYVNFTMDEGQERVQAAYRDNYPRLVQIKQHYDPANLFRVNHNIKPAMKAAVRA